MKDIIFTKIMDLIEKETKIPMTEKDLKEWLLKDEINQNIYEIYLKASRSRR